MKTTKYILTLALTVCCALGNVYAINSSYYSSIDGKKDSGLREALTTLLYNNHTKGLSYDWDFDGIDWDNSGNVYDIYSDCGHKKTDATGSYKCCCDAINREHVVPQSTFDSKYPQYADRHHLYVVDGKVNGYRSNYAFGECSSGTKGSCNNSSTVKPSEGTATCSNHEFGKLGTSTFTEVKISDKVYEPDDEYKGDIARAIMYMVVRYATADYCKVKSGSGTSANEYPVTAWSASSNCGLMFSSSLSTNYGLSNYGKALLLKWHRNDPVSAREIARNEGVAAKQGNRNPFIDYPCLAEYLWGNKAGETVTLSSLVGTFSGSWTTGDGCPCGDDPAITLPTGDIFVGSTEANAAVTKTITVQGVNLESNLSLALSGTNNALFSLSATSIQKTYAEAGCTVTITYTPTSAGNHSAVLTISGGGLSSSRTFNLSGTCCNPYMVTLSRNGLTETIGACGTYTLPTADDEDDPCDGWEFQGWLASTTSFTEGTTTAPTAWVTSVTSTKTLHAVYGKTETTGGGSSSTASYTFTSKSWAATQGNWTSGKDGNGYSNSGVQVTEATSGANATCPSSYSNITSIVVSYCTNSSKGAGTIVMSVGSTQVSQIVSTEGGTTARNLTFDFSSTKPSGSPKITVNCTTNSIYVCGVTITYGGGSTSTTTYKKLPCTTYTISYVDEDGIATGGSYQASETTALAGTTISLDYDEAMGYEFTGWTVTNVSTSATITVTNGQFTMPEANVTVEANFTALCSKLDAPDVNATPGNGQITLTWTDVAGADHYTVSIGKGEGYTTECSNPTVGNITHSGTTNTCVITGLTNGLEYTTYVVANGVSSICDSDADEDTATPTAVVPTEVIVSFNANGGEGTMSNQTIPYNEATALDANTFSRTGYTFQGWATVQGGDKAYNDGASVTLTEDITLYAVWQINSHDVTFDQPASGGTFTVNSSSSSPISNVNYGSTVTIVVTPTNSHFTVNSVTVSGASGSVAVSGEGNTRTFTMPDEDVTVAVTMNEDPKYTVKWYVNNVATDETNYAGSTLAGIAAPTIDCNGKVFQGWTATANYSSETTAPTDLFTDASTKTMPVNGTNYYAVFATVETTTTSSGSEGWLETAISDLTSSDVFVIVGTNSSASCALPSTVANASPTAASVTISNNQISSTIGDELKWNISGNNSDGFTFYPNGDSNNWLGSNTKAESSSNTNIRVGTESRKLWLFDSNDQLVTNDSYTARYLALYNTADFRGYVTATTSKTTFKFYKNNSGSSSTTIISDYTTTCAACESKVTITKGTPSNGSFNINKVGEQNNCSAGGLVVTVTDITPTEGYRFKEITQSGINAGVTIDNDANTITYAQNVTGASTINVVFEPLPTYTIRFIDNGSIISTQTVYDGETAVIPADPTPCDGYTFVGWWTAELDADNTTSETWITDFTATKDQDYYAVYRYTETNGGSSSTPVTKTMSAFTTVSGNVDGDENISYVAAQGEAATAPAINSGEIRIYQNGGTLTITANNSKKITAVTIGSSMATSVTYAINGGSASDDQDISAGETLSLSGLNASSILFTCTGTDKNHRLYLNYLSVTYSDGGSGTTTTYYTTASVCEKMLVVEYGGARVALAHDNTNTVAALPLMYFGGNYFCPNLDKNGNPASAPNPETTLTWQVAERTDGYYIKSGDNFLAQSEGDFELNKEKFLWPKSGTLRLAYDAATEAFVVAAGQQSEDLPGITAVDVPSTISTTELKSQRDLTIGKFGTICLPHAVALPFTWGVRVYSIEAKKMNDKDELSGIYIVEETEMLTAGKPYLIEAKETQMTMWYPTGAETVTETVSALGLVGNLGTTSVYVPVGCYGISNNQLRRVTAKNTATIGQYKAYIDLTDVPVEGVGSSMQSMYKVLYTAEGENVATDTEQLSDPAGINWNEPVYNILGIRVDRNCTGVLIQNGKKFLVTHPRP